jgi:Fe2+ transport system protein FeoA
LENPLATQSQLTYFRSRVSKQIECCQKPDDCPQAELCQLSNVRPGASVRIKQLSGAPEVAVRLRELGFCEEQRIRLLSRHTNIICQVCQARLGISAQIAEHIWVETIPSPEPLPSRKVA